MPLYHYQRETDRNMTLCGQAILRYDNKGRLVPRVTCTSDPQSVTCKKCKAAPSRPVTGRQGAAPRGPEGHPPGLHHKGVRFS